MWRRWWSARPSGSRRQVIKPLPNRYRLVVKFGSREPQACYVVREDIPAVQEEQDSGRH